MKTFRNRLTAVVSVLLMAMAAGAHTYACKAEADTVAGRQLMWVPDSLAPAFDAVLQGRSKIVRDYSKVDLDERVIVNGDTVNLIMKDRNFGRYDRGLFNYLYIPRGQWHFTLTASYGEFNAKDLEMFDLLSDFDFKGHMFSLKPSIAYFIRNNMSVGLRFVYSNARANLDALKMDISEDLNMSLSGIMYRNESYAASATYTSYIGIGRASRFGIYNEVELSFESGHSDFRRPFAGKPKTTHTTYMEAGLNFSPGVCVFIMQNVSFHVSFGVFGFYLRNSKQQVDGEDLGNRLTSGANFRFNIFNINFGIGVHI